MERLFDDASSIQRLLPWISNKEDIVIFLRTIPIDHNHLRIPLSINHFFDLRDQSEENSEQNIENDAREIVILLPDIPYILIKNRLKSLGNVSNRKEIVIRQIINDRPELRRILEEIDSAPDRKRHCESIADEESKEPNIKIKIRKLDGSLEVVSSIKEEILRSPKQEILRSPKLVTGVPEFFRQRSLEESSSADSTADQNKMLPSTSNTVIQKDTFNLIDYLKEVTQCSQEKIELLCNKMNLPTSERPHETLLNAVLNKLFDDNIIEIDDGVIEFDTSDIEFDGSDDDVNLDNVLDLAYTRKRIIKPANCLRSLSQLNSPVEVIPEIPLQQFINRINPQNNGNEKPGLPPIKDEPLSDEASGYHTEQVPSPIKKEKLGMPTIKDKPLSDEVSGYHTIQVPYPITKEKLGMPTIIRMPTIKDEPLSDKVSGNHTEQVPSPIKKEKLGMPTIIRMPTIKDEPLSDEASGYHTEQVPSPIKKGLFEAENCDLPEPTIIKEEQLRGPSRTEEALQELHYDEKLVMRIMEMFPEACPHYIKNICRGKRFKHIDHVVTIILNEDAYPKRAQRPPSPPKEYDIEEQLEIVKALLPDADPTYLRWKCETIGNNPVELNEFINADRKNKSYPTMKEYLRKQKLSAQSKQYTTEFNVKHFIELFPDPEKTFRDTSRVCSVDNYTHLYICNFFQNRYDKLSVKCIRSTLAKMNNKILLTDNALLKSLLGGNVIKNRRKPVLLNDPPQNIAVLQELAYIRHMVEIEAYLKEKKEQEERDKKRAEEMGLLNNCQCCFDDEVMPKDTFYCPKDCTFCRSCIQKSCEVNLGDGKTDFKCLNDCQEEFTLHTLQEALPPKLFSKLAQKKALAEVKAAGIGELESCPFCDFASIPNPADKIFRCLNPDCTKESCRLCKEENHIPYKCDEVERDADVKARVFVENKMTEALLRKCWQCSKSFFKEEGCNMMTCTCGAKMCYICGKSVNDYSHFNGIGGDKFQLCPLYSDTNDFNQKNVIKAAEEAKAKVDPSKLKIDPSLDVQQHYQKRKRELPEEPHIRLLNDALRHVRHGAQAQVQVRQAQVQVRQAQVQVRQGNIQNRAAQVVARQVQIREARQVQIRERFVGRQELRQLVQDLGQQLTRHRQPNHPVNEEH